MTAADIFLATEHIGKYWEHGSYSTELGMMKDVCPDDSSLTVTNCFLRNAKVPADAETSGKYCKCWIETDRVGRITALAHDAPNKPELRTDDTNPVTTPNAMMAEPEVIGGSVGSSTPQVEKTPLEPPTPPAAAAEQGNILESSTTQPPASPEPESFDGAQIPWELKKVKQWLCWQYGERDGKKTKIPINPETYENTSAPEAAWSYEKCRNAMPAGYRGYVGLGFSLRNGIVGVDLDHILDEEGHLIPEYADLETNIIDKIASYTERSPSGTGLHILFRCDDIPQECKAGRKRKENIEMYCEGRFFTVTGKVWRDLNELRNLSAEEYRDVYSMLFGGPAAEPPAPAAKETSLSTPAETAKERPKPTRSDSEVFLRINRNPKYKALWNGDITGYPSASEADFALMCQLASLTDCNKEQMIRMFRQSGLGKREKAERPDYLDTTATNAIREVPQSERQTAQTPGAKRDVSVSFRGSNWQAEEAHHVCKEMSGELPDIRDACNGIFVVIDPCDNMTKLVSSGKDDSFQRWCAKVFPDTGYDAKFAEEVFRNISVLHTADPIPEIDISKPLTALPCKDGYISLKDGRRCERPEETEYCPFMLDLNVKDAEYDPNYRPTGRVFSDLMTYVGSPAVSYLLSVIAASIIRIPANRRVVIFTGPSRSSKTTLGMILSEIGLAPPRNVDFSSEINGDGKYRPELATYISRYPMLFINDPTCPDGNAVKKLCDPTQQYERKYTNQSSVYQRATPVLTMNHPPRFKTSAMETKVFFINSQLSFRDAEIPLDKYMEIIREDGSLRDVWQAILHKGISTNWEIRIPVECTEHNQRMHIGAAPLQKWLSMCKSASHTHEEDFHETSNVYENYMCYVNPFTYQGDVKEILNKKAKSASWIPNPKKDGLEGISKSDIIKQLVTMGITPTRYKGKRGFFVRLPSSPDYYDEIGTVEKEEIEITTAFDAWTTLFPSAQKRID